MEVQLAGSQALFERDRELGRLGALLDQAAGGAGCVAVIEGPAGIGKTALARAARDAADERGFSVLTGRGSPIEQEFAFGVARQLFEAPLRRSTPGERHRLLSGAASLAAPIVIGADEEPATSIFPYLHGLYWLCVNLAERSPLLVIVDDAHWADQASLRWLDYLARRLEDLRTLVLVARRPAERDTTSSLLDVLPTHPASELLKPSPLSEHGSTGLTEELLGGGVDKTFGRACFERTGGNPFLLRELLTVIAAEGIAPTAEGAPRVPELLPETVARATLARLGSLGEECRTVARSVAILGSDVQLDDVVVLSGLSSESVVAALESLSASMILEDGEPWRFVHPLVRDAIYYDINQTRRAELHRRAAELLDRREAPVERIAAHLRQSPHGGDARAVQRLSEAARRALSHGSPTAAVSFLERALAEPPAGAERARVLRELASAQALSAPTQAARHLYEALELTADPPESIGIRRELANALVSCAEPVEAFQVLEQALSTPPGDADRELRLRMQAELLSIGLLTPALSPAVERLVDELPPLEGNTPGERLVLANLARWRSLLPVPAEEVADLAERALGGGQLLHDQTADSPTFPIAVIAIHRAGRFEQATRMIELMHSDAARRGSLTGEAIATVLEAGLHYRTGELRTIEALSRRTIELCLETGWTAALPAAASYLIDALNEMGKHQDAEATIKRFEFDQDIPDTVGFFLYILAARGRLRIAQGRVQEGVDDLLEVGRRERGRNEEPLRWRSSAAFGYLALGDTDQARTLAQQQLDHAHRCHTPWSAAPALRAIGLSLGGTSGLHKLRDAVDLIAPTAHRLEQAHALADLGAALRRNKQRTEAREVLKHALETAHRAGASALEEIVRTELRAAGARPRSIMLSGVDALTPSERRVAEMAAQGRSNPEIAQALFVTRKTVELHLGNTYRKLDINSREQLPKALRTD